MLASGELLPAILLIGAGTSIFLIADNGMQGFNLLNAIFVILGYAAGAVVTATGLYLVYQAILPVAAAVPLIPAL